jgi:phospholipid/cholesterol/gamma-HCH transport system substrate-binding protein
MAMHALPRNLTRLIIAGLAAVIVIGAAVYLLLPTSDKSVTARFERAVGLYAGSDVRLHGVKIGSITKVTPDGDGVLVRMSYDKKIKLPAYADDAKVVRAAIIPPSLVSDRYVEFKDFSSCNNACAVLADKAMIPANQTASPVELDDIYAALDKLDVALGPQGANKASGSSPQGPLSDLIDVGAANLQGNGKALGDTVTNLSKAVQTLASSREDLFGTVKNLQLFTDALVANDAQVRKFNDQLDQVTAALADERQSLGEALKNLSTALKDVADFVKANGDTLHADIVGLKSLTQVLAKQKDALNETFRVAPVALSNLVHAYNPTSGTLDTRSNLGNIADPALICSALAKTGELPILGGTIKQTCDALSKLLGGLPALPGLGGPGTGGGPPPLPGLPSLPGLGG